MTEARVRWYGYTPNDNTLDAADHMPNHFINKCWKCLRARSYSEEICTGHSANDIALQERADSWNKILQKDNNLLLINRIHTDSKVAQFSF